MCIRFRLMAWDVMRHHVPDQIHPLRYNVQYLLGCFCQYSNVRSLTYLWYSTLPCSVLAVEVAVADGFCQVVRLNLLAALQVGYGASHLEDTIVGSGGEVEAVHGGL